MRRHQSADVEGPGPVRHAPHHGATDDGNDGDYQRNPSHYIYTTTYGFVQTENAVQIQKLAPTQAAADELYWKLKPESVNRGQVDVHTLFASLPQPSLSETLGNGRFLLFRVGDCISMHNIHGAIYDALRLCKDF